MSVKRPFPAVNKGIWYMDDGRPQMKIVNITKEDTGRYKCEYTALDNRIHIMECSVLVLPKGETVTSKSYISR